jgi:hypothetical protein
MGNVNFENKIEQITLSSVDFSKFIESMTLWVKIIHPDVTKEILLIE